MSILELTKAPFDREAPGVDAAAFKDAMRQLAGAVSVVTIGAGANRTGFTATSVSSFSIEPPTVLVTLNTSSSSWPALQEAGAFAINILAGHQAETADRFAGRGGIMGKARYAGQDWLELGSGSAGLADALAVIDCKLDEAIVRHSHAIVLGRVISVRTASHRPLLYWHGAYRQVLS